jgi:hypothetical protein
MNELIVMVEEAPEGGFVAPFLSASNAERRTQNFPTCRVFPARPGPL